MSVTSNAGDKSRDTSYMSIFQNFLVKKPDSPPSNYVSESEDDESASSGLQSVKEHNESTAESKPGATKGKKRKKKGKKKVQKAVPTPLRTSARRKAKEDVSFKFRDDDNLEDGDSDFDLGDSDTDPAWSPLKENSDDEGNRRRGSRRKRRPTPPSMSSDSDEQPLAKNHKVAKTESTKPAQNNTVQVSVSVASTTTATATQVTSNSLQRAPARTANVSCEGNTVSATNGSSGATDFRPGEFVVMKEDLHKEYPPIWRLDGKTLLQKYEPFKSNDEMLYRNLTTFSGWTPASQPRFLQAPVKFRVQNRKEIIVEYLQDQLVLDDADYAEELSKDLEPLQDTFEVYIQTLISHVLDNNFLPEIYHEKDEYFLGHMKTIDDLAEKRKTLLKNICLWNETPLKAVSKWPYFKIKTSTGESKDKLCVACKTGAVCSQMELEGEPYDNKTLDPCPTNGELSQSLLLCVICSDRMQLYHKVSHQKYLLFVECAKQVFIKKGDAAQNITMILNDMLTDADWLKQVIDSMHEPLKAIDKLDMPYLKKFVAEKYQANKPTKI